MGYDPAQILLALQKLCPGLQPNVDYELAVIDDKPQISVWFNKDVVQPTQQEIDAVDTDALLSPVTVLPQDLMAQFTVADAEKIRVAVAGNTQFWLLWSSLQAQKDPMNITNARFLTGWAALVQVLGQPRMTEISTALGIKL